MALKLTEQTPPEWKQRSTDSVCFVMASHTWMDGDVAEEQNKEEFNYLFVYLDGIVHINE